KRIEGADSLGIVQRRGRSSCVSDSRAPVSAVPGVPAGMDRSAVLPRPACAGAAAHHPAGALCPRLLFALSLGAPLSLHVVRRPADQAPQSADLPLLLRRSPRVAG